MSSDPPAISVLKKQELAADLIASRKFKWCRARLLHALAGAHEQGVLREVLDELLPKHGDIAGDIVNALWRAGWFKPGIVRERRKDAPTRR